MGILGGVIRRELGRSRILGGFGRRFGGVGVSVEAGFVCITRLIF